MQFLFIFSFPLCVTYILHTPPPHTHFLSGTLSILRFGALSPTWSWRFQHLHCFSSCTSLDSENQTVLSHSPTLIRKPQCLYHVLDIEVACLPAVCEYSRDRDELIYSLMPCF
ncbi:hypothetical protein AMECASPLE_013535 [Ameca splendens]|uniref:Secreted protein n=1 Tax=Ameca splendens TaxID=208324 RepID=A0ABV0ZAL0_9TELE